MTITNPAVYVSVLLNLIIFWAWLAFVAWLWKIKVFLLFIFYLIGGRERDGWKVIYS
jgi:hypothetical protein